MKRLPLLIGILAMALSHQAAANEAVEAGWVEWALVADTKIRMKAKLDTGARTSSLDATEIGVFKREGKEWVRFTLRDQTGRPTVLERPLVRRVVIRRAGTAREERYVVTLDICIGPKRKAAEVNLSDRADLNYPLLIGRNFLAGALLVNAGRTFTAKPSC